MWPTLGHCHGIFWLAFYFLLGELPGADVAKELLEAIRAKKDVDQLQTILNNIPANASGHEDLNSDGINIFFSFVAGVFWMYGMIGKGLNKVSYTRGYGY